MMESWREIGPIVLLQLQVKSMKSQRADGRKVYQPDEALWLVEQAEITSNGLTAMQNGTLVYDKHHINHPTTRHRGTNPVSIGFSSHYVRLAERFGPHLPLGIAGENIIVQVDYLLTVEDLEKSLAIRHQDGKMTHLIDLYAMPPCEPFARYCLNIDAGEVTPSDAPTMKQSLVFLSEGMRGFAGKPTNITPHTLCIGDVLMVAMPTNEV
jgi:hypothetical protein